MISFNFAFAYSLRVTLYITASACSKHSSINTTVSEPRFMSSSSSSSSYVEYTTGLPPPVYLLPITNLKYAAIARENTLATNAKLINNAPFPTLPVFLDYLKNLSSSESSSIMI